MKINNTSIRGVFLYSPDVEFEYGDFVVSGDSIYLCKPKGSQSIIGVEPSTDLVNYEAYLGGSTASLDYSLGYLAGDNKMGSDIYVSALYLQGILNSYLCGFSEKGIITDYIDLIDNEIKTTERYTPIIGSATEGAFDLILVAPELNNAYLKVSREFIDSDQSLGVVSTILGTAGGSGDIILRQYTYIDSTRDGNPIVRVQELVDPDQALVMYRYGVLSPDIYKIIESSDFKSSFYTTSNARDVINECLTYVSNKETEYKAKYNAMKGSFRYRSVTTFNNRSIIKAVVLNNSNTPGITFDQSDTDAKCLVTVITSEWIQQGEIRLKRNSSLTFDLFDIYHTSESQLSYYVNDECSIITSLPGADSSVMVQISSTRDKDAAIEDIYYRYKPE